MLDLVSAEVGYDVKKTRTLTVENFRQHQDKQSYAMNIVYQAAGIGKPERNAQGHWQAVKREGDWAVKAQSYLGFIAKVHEVYP